LGSGGGKKARAIEGVSSKNQNCGKETDQPKKKGADKEAGGGSPAGGVPRSGSTARPAFPSNRLQTAE